MYVGDSKSLTTTITPSNATNKAINCTSSDNNIATVSASGNACVVKGVAVGKVVITVTTKDGNKTATANVIVNNKPTPPPTTVKVTSITLSPTSKTVDVGGTAVISVGILPTNATNQTVTCKSSNSVIFTVTTSGKSCIIKGVKAGNATLIVTANDGSGVRKTASITVKSSGGGTGSGGQCYCCGNSQGCNYKWSEDGSLPGNNCGKANKAKAQCVGSTTKECNITGCVECDSNSKCTRCNELKGYVLDGKGGCKTEPVSTGTCVCYKSTYGGKCNKIYGSGQTFITSCLNYCYGSNVCLQHSDKKYYCTEIKNVSGAKESSCSQLYGSGWTGTLERETEKFSCGTYANCTQVCGSHSMNAKSGSCTK